MRTTSQRQHGSAGELRVAATFEDLGRGVAQNPTATEVGTDLFLMARDDRLVDLGLVLGAQVKTESRWFKRPVRDNDGVVSGWWYRERDHRHFDAWLRHQLPHVLVLHDRATGLSYWAAITAEAVLSTGKGAKIFVPASNLVDQASLGRLRAVASSKAAQPNWEHSAWTGAAVAPAQRLRHALITPRLIAPHPNRDDAEEPDVAQVVALIVRLRLVQLAEVADRHPAVPRFELHLEWPPEWQLAAAVYAHVVDGSTADLKAMLGGDRLPHEQAVVTVLYAAAQLQEGRADAALSAVERLLARDELDQIDHAWVRLQHARALGDLGRRTEARDEAVALIDLIVEAPGEATAAAIAGAAAHTAFSMSDWQSADIPTTIAAADTTSSWWRQQIRAWGLAAQAERQFDTWCQPGTPSPADADIASTELRSAFVIAGALGDQVGWRQAAKDLAIHLLSDGSYSTNDELVTYSIDLLGRIGDKETQQKAIIAILTGGPALAARAVGEQINLDRSTPTSAAADLNALVQTSDLLSTERAQTLLDWSITVYRDPSAYVARVHPRFDVESRLAELITAVAPVAGLEAYGRAMDFALALPPQTRPGAALQWCALVRQAPDAIWTEERAYHAAARAADDHWQLRYAFLGASQHHVANSRAQLTAEACTGSLDAAAALGAVSDLDNGTAAALIESLAIGIERQTEQASRGEFQDAIHRGRNLAQINIVHPELANWDAIFRLLTETHWGPYISGALYQLAEDANELPDVVTPRLAELASAIVENPDVIHAYPLARSNALVHAKYLHATLKRRMGAPFLPQLAVLAHGNAPERRAAAAVAGQADDPITLGVLLALAGDSDSRVRARAARGLAVRTALGDEIARASLPTLIEDNGVAIQRALAATVAEHPALARLAELQPLRVHTSWQVRSTFERACAITSGELRLREA